MQRVTPVESVCELDEAALHKAVSVLAAEEAASMADGHSAVEIAAQADASEHTPADSGKEELPALHFAVAWRSRYAEPAPAASGAPLIAKAEQDAPAPAEPNGHAAAAESKAAPTKSEAPAKAACKGMGRNEAIAAAAAAFVEGTAGVRRAVVNLKKPDVVVMVEGLPVDKRMLCALSIVNSDITLQRPKLNIMSVGIS